ncbi:MAG: hypothetical protein BWY13_01396 [Euryarchaeota archaeon ADurb.Bin190]|nr:MAG: hypothetical protein BWY13_01396 [Euryarchaeota archaeon ADurb.Bin190]
MPVGPLLLADDRSEDGDLCSFLSFHSSLSSRSSLSLGLPFRFSSSLLFRPAGGLLCLLQYALCYSIRRLGLDFYAVHRAVGHPDAGEEQPEIVVYLGNRPHCAAGILGCGLLLYGYGRGESLDAVHIGLVHLAQELAGVGGKRFHIAALPLGIDGVEGQGGLARAGDAGDDYEPVTGQLYGDVL